MTDDVRLPYLTDESNRLPREIHAVGSDWFYAEMPCLRESYPQRRRGRRQNIALILIGSLCLCLIGWSAFVYGATQLWNWVLP